MLNKISETEFSVGIYLITKTDKGDLWLMTNTDTGLHDALFFNRHTALRTAIINHSCGYVVQEATRELLNMAVLEMKGESK